MNFRILFLAAAAALAPLSAHAYTITVTSDSGGSNVMDACVLRDAIRYANTGTPTGGCGVTTATTDVAPNSPGVMTQAIIELPPQVTITLTAVDDAERLLGLPSVTLPLIIYGNGSTIRRDPELACVLDGMSTPGEFGLFHNESLLELHAVTLENGCADAVPGASGQGGAIHNTGQVLLEAVTLRGNRASYSGGAVYSSGYGNMAGRMSLARVRVEDNQARSGGGIYLEGSSATLVAAQTTLLLNSASEYFSGGGVYAGPGTQVELVNATFGQNSAGSGAALQADGSATLSFVTIAENLITSGSGGALQVGPSPVQLLTLRNTLLSGNSGGAGNCQFNGGNVVDAVANLASDGSCAGFAMQNVATTVAPLADAGGGYGASYPLLPSSPAVDAVTACTDTHDDPVTTDQRGAARPQGAACDIGAFELSDRVFNNGFEFSAN